MESDRVPGGGMQAIAIAREYGSGGGEIARRLAARLGWQLLDHDIVAQAAERLGLTAGEADTLDEHGEGFWGRLLVRMEYSVPGGATPQPLINPEDPEQEFQAAVRRLVEQAAATGRVVIVGRGSPVVLAERRDVLRVKIVAPLSARLAYVTHREGLSEAQAAARIRQKEQERQRALRHAYGDRCDDAYLYDLVVNTGALPLDSAVALIVAALADKGRQLGAPAAARGPLAGLAPYPTPPADFGPAGQPA